MLKKVRFLPVLMLASVVASAGLMTSPVIGQGTKTKESAKTGYFEVYTDRGGKFRFRLKDADGEQLAMSKTGYAKKEDILAVIKKIQEVAGTARIEEQE